MRLASPRAHCVLLLKAGEESWSPTAGSFPPKPLSKWGMWFEDLPWSSVMGRMMGAAGRLRPRDGQDLSISLSKSRTNVPRFLGRRLGWAWSSFLLPLNLCSLGLLPVVVLNS